MKIGVCFTGQPRSYKKGFEYIYKNLLSEYDCDVFIHTWFYNFVDYTELMSVYEPKSILIEQSLRNEYPKNFRYCPYNIISTFYSVYKSIQLAELYSIQNNILYDWIFRIRFDFALNIKLDLINLNSKKIYIPFSMSEEYYNDQFAFSNFENMLNYSKLYLNIPTFLKKIPLGAESYIVENLSYYNLRSDVIRLDLHEPFPPGKYDGMRNSLIRDDFDFWATK